MELNARTKIVMEQYQKHKRVCAEWDHGEPVKAWFDEDHNLCIKYEDGKWWHYSTSGKWW